ncbi:MAG: DUF366 family protein [candidate division WOR-3 bacterium]
MKTRFIKEELTFTGEQLRSLFAYDTYNILGDSLIAFIGACDISLKEAVDLESQKVRRYSYVPKMLHFLAEHFEMDVEKAILRSYLLLDIVKDILNEKLGTLQIKRVGNELYDGESRVAISMAASSPISSLVYVGINVVPPTETPAKGLEDYQIDIMEFGNLVLERYAKDSERINQMRYRTRWVE